MNPRPERVPVQAPTKPDKAQPNRSEESQVQMLRERLMELGMAQGFDEKQVQEAVAAPDRQGVGPVGGSRTGLAGEGRRQQAQQDTAGQGFLAGQSIQYQESSGAVSSRGLPRFSFTRLHEKKETRYDQNTDPHSLGLDQEG